MGNFCRNCGTPLNDATTQCPSCNYTINHIPTPQVELQPDNVSKQQPNTQGKHKHKKRHGCLKALLIMILIPCVILAALLLLPDDQTDKPLTDSTNGISSKTDASEKSNAPDISELYEKYTVFKDSGQCGENAYWKISEDEKLVIIYGTGELKEHDAMYEGDGYTSDKYNNIKYLIIEEGITATGYGNFSFYNNLRYVYLPSTLVDFKASSISNCDNLYYISFPNDNPVYTVENGIMFSKDKTELVKYPEDKEGHTYEIPSHVKTIKSDAFCGMQNLTKIVVPPTVTKIEGYAFSGNYDSLKEVYISDNIDDIGDGLFSSCSALEKVHLPSSISKIPTSTFHGCESLKKIDIPENVTEIGYWAFGDCVSLKEVVIPEKVTVLWGLAFYGCKNLSKITLPKNLEYIGHADGLKETNARVFYNCTSLTSIIIPKGVTIRASYVFKEWTPEQTIYFEDSEASTDWDPKWASECNATVVWGYK